MLENFLRAWDIDILLVQEVTKQVLHDLRGYSTLYNIGTNGRGTAIVAMEGITLENLTRLPSGRAIEAKLDNKRLRPIRNSTQTRQRNIIFM